MKLFTFFPLFHRILYTDHICHIVYYECRCDHLFLGNYQGILEVDIDNVCKKNKHADLSKRMFNIVFIVLLQTEANLILTDRGNWKNENILVVRLAAIVCRWPIRMLVLLKVSKKSQAWNMASRLVPQILLQMSFHLAPQVATDAVLRALVLTVRSNPPSSFGTWRSAARQPHSTWYYDHQS